MLVKIDRHIAFFEQVKMMIIMIFNDGFAKNYSLTTFDFKGKRVKEPVVS